MSKKSISINDIHDMQESFNSRDANKIAMNAVCHGSALKVAMNRHIHSEFPMSFSTEIKSGDITNQKMSGRCWMFAGLNALRLKAIDKMKLKTFELSQSYIMFYDKLERSNYFLENILETLNEDITSRIVMHLLAKPIEDGGQWDMFVNLVEKYGVVPKDVYPESTSSSNTNVMNSHLNEKLREFALILRSEHQKNNSIEELRSLKSDMLQDIYKILTIHNGVPPESFHWGYKDKNDKFHQHNEKITPKGFFKKYIDVNLDDYVSLISCPTDDKPFNKNYTVSFLGNLVEGRKVSYLNVDIDTMKQAALKTLKNNNPVWFGCDVGKQLASDEGILDVNGFSFDLLYDTKFKMNKAQRVDYGHSLMTHAMLFTGVHEQNGKTTRWKVENSWGEEKGKKGFLVMSDAWFDEYVFQVVVLKDNLDKKLLKEFENDPIVLKPWDPMGSLA